MEVFCEATKKNPFQFDGLYDETIEGLACTDENSSGVGSYFEEAESSGGEEVWSEDRCLGGQVKDARASSDQWK